MTTPQFSLRRLLVIVTIAGVLCIIPAVATDDLLWLMAPGMAVLAALVLSLVAAAMFALTGGVMAVKPRRGPSGDPPGEN